MDIIAHLLFTLFIFYIGFEIGYVTHRRYAIDRGRDVFYRKHGAKQ